MTIDYYLQGKLDVLISLHILTQDEVDYMHKWQHDSMKFEDARKELEIIQHEFLDIKKQFEALS